MLLFEQDYASISMVTEDFANVLCLLPNTKGCSHYSTTEFIVQAITTDYVFFKSTQI